MEENNTENISDIKEEKFDYNTTELEFLNEGIEENICINEERKIEIHERVVDWSNIHWSKLDFAENYKVCYGAAGQIIKGMNMSLLQINNSSDEYQNELQNALKEYIKEVILKYEELFMNDILNSDSIKKQVYGANLNGIDNNGRLKLLIGTSRINKSLSYDNAQFGQLLAILSQRFSYLETREYSNVERYKNDIVQRNYFLELQIKSREFLNFINNDENSIKKKWMTKILELKTKYNKSIKQPGNYNNQMHNSKPNFTKIFKDKKNIFSNNKNCV